MVPQPYQHIIPYVGNFNCTALGLYIRLNNAQNNILKKSIVIQNENDSNQIIYSTSKEESLAENNIKNEDDILQGQNTAETKNYASILPSDDRHPENKQLMPETGYTASELELVNLEQ